MSRLPPPLDDWVERPLAELARERQEGESTENGCLGGFAGIVAIAITGIGLFSILVF